MAKPRLLFISNLFPDASEPYRGLDNATVLHALSDRWDIATLAVRPSLFPFGGGLTARDEDQPLAPRFLKSWYVPKVGHGLNHRLMARAFRRRIAPLRGAFNVALVSWLFPDACAISLLAEEMGFPFVAIAQGSDVHQYLKVPRRRRIIAESIPSAASVITRSSDLAARLADVGLPKERLHTIYNGVNLDLFRPAEHTAIRRELRLPMDARIIIFVGNFLPIKNPGLVVQAVARLLDKPDFSNVFAVFVGGGPSEADITFQASRGPAAERVMLAGRLAAPMVAKFIQAADVLCLPSDNEGVPNVVLEAFGCGTRVVATAVGGIPEVHNAPYLGRLVPPRNLEALTKALGEVLSELPETDRIRAHAERFTWKKTADAYHELLMAASR